MSEMRAEEFKSAYDAHVAEGLGGIPLLRALMEDTGGTVDTVVGLLREAGLCDKKMTISASNIRYMDKKKQSRAGTRKARTKQPEEITPPNDYMEQLTPVWKHVRELREGLDDLDKQKKLMQAELKNLTATLRQMAEYAENGDDAK